MNISMRLEKILEKKNRDSRFEIRDPRDKIPVMQDKNSGSLVAPAPDLIFIMPRAVPP